MKVIFLIFALPAIVACKKNNSKETKQSFIRFTYNGKVYNYTADPNTTLQAGASYLSDNNRNSFPGVFINDPSIVGISGARLEFSGNRCAYMGAQISIYNPGCILKDISSGSPKDIDSVKTFYYESGTLNISETNCKTERKYDIVTAQYYDLSYCTLSGTFNLVLTNKNNTKIILSNGEFYTDKAAK